MSGRAITGHRDQGLDGDQYTYLRGAGAGVIHSVDDYPYVGDPLAKSDQDIAEEQTAQSGIEGSGDCKKAPMLVGCRGRWYGVLLQPQLQVDTQSTKHDGDREADSYAGHKSIAIEKQSSGDWADNDRKTLGEGLNPDPHGVLFGGHICGHARKHSWPRDATPSHEQEHTTHHPAPSADSTE